MKKFLKARTHAHHTGTAKIAAIVFAALLSAMPFHAALAATASDLGPASNFAVLAGTAVTCTE
jgi:hypothetical protein